MKSSKEDNPRNTRYREDREYRREVRKNHRERAREKSTSPSNRRKASIAEAKKVAVMREVVGISGDILETPTLSTSEIGKALGGYGASQLGRWFRSGQFPRPRYKVKSRMVIDDRIPVGKSVYLLDEACLLCRILREHQKEFHYFRSDHRDTIRKLKESIDE